ncbi:MAG: bifunctional folylpolyglutamate synthase/dihydrofolate synthase [candidate division Zixibacteria bacterium]|nr:bifunctional folylpolyglutamate synthase/dihydrofolate synthase [candidate division Zixibacteria bacterium]
MNYPQTLSYIYNLERFGVKLGLESITTFLEDIGNPQLDFPSIHIAGTNGKGSIAAILESILCSAEYRVGLYTSPHLVDLRERIRICGKQIDQKSVVRFVNRYKNEIDRNKYTFFEVITALAFEYFSRKKVDIAILETGLGGRLDATNVVMPEVSIITNIGLEHTDILGKAIPQIAFEKGGIIKKGVPVISGVQNKEAVKVLKDICNKRDTSFLDVNKISKWKIKDMDLRGTCFDLRTDSNQYKDLKINLIGEHQVQNAAVAICAAELLSQKGWKISKQDIYEGLKKVNWRARFEIFRENPLVILDVAHNPEGISVLIDTFNCLFKNRKIIFVFGVLDDKDYKEMLKKLRGKAKLLILTEPNYYRAQKLEKLEKEANRLKIRYKVIPKVKDACLYALKTASKKDILCITGSHFTVGEFLESY